jgi:putative PIN family toxin of toxin-antitoxin system
MRVVLDTNILLSALINRHGIPAQLIVAWRERRYDLLTSTEQLLELGGVARRPVLRARIIPSTVGRLIRDLRKLAEVLTRLPEVTHGVTQIIKAREFLTVLGIKPAS